jgi:predicted nuclease of predicted toxin-antitoxin system
MKALLDENIDVRLKKYFDGSEHEVVTVKDMGWNGLKNGELLKRAAENSFDILVAVDKNLPYQQNTGKSINWLQPASEEVTSMLLPHFTGQNFRENPCR